MEDNDILAWVKLWTFCNIYYSIDESDYAKFHKGRDVDFHFYEDSTWENQEYKRKLIDRHIQQEQDWREAALAREAAEREALRPRKMSEADL